MKANEKKLSKEELGLIQNHFRPVSFPNSFDIVYEDQVPNMGIVILEGQAFLKRRKKILGPLDPGTVLGIHELLNDQPVKFGCCVSEGAKIILVKKSELYELLGEPDSKIAEILMA